MTVILLDSSLVAVPGYAEDETGAISIIERIVDWARSAAFLPAQSLAVSQYLQDDLWLAQAAPLRAEISTMLEMFHLTDVFSTSEIFSSYQTILSRSLSVQDCGGREVIDHEAFACEPNLVANMSPQGLRAASERIAATAALMRREGNCWVVGSGLPIAGPLTASINSRITSADPGLEPGETIEVSAQQIHFVDRVEDLCTGEIRQFAFGLEADAHFHLSVALEALRLLKKEDPAATLAHVPKFYVGGDFVATLPLHQCGEGQRFGDNLLESCARIVLGRPKSPLLPFGKPKQLFREDGAGGLRSHLTKENEGLRIMAWNRDGALEFANVGVKMELQILSRDRSTAFSATY